MMQKKQYPSRDVGNMETLKHEFSSEDLQTWRSPRKNKKSDECVRMLRQNNEVTGNREQRLSGDK